MKKSYKIEVDCANCAQKMADPHDTMVNVLAACKKVEDDCEIFDI